MGNDGLTTNNHTPSHGCRDGFTLIELLVVIAVLAVLIALLIPAIGNARALAVSVKCKVQMRNIGVGMNNYLLNNQDTYPQQIGAFSGWEPWETRTWWGAIGPYIDWSRPYIPSANRAEGTIGHCPNHFEQPGSFSYVANMYVVNNFLDDGSPPVKSTDIAKPYERILSFEVHTASFWPNTSHGIQHGKAPFVPVTGTHGVNLNYMYCDGHVETHPQDNLPIIY